MIIALDGPSASGKGTLAKKLAAHFGLPYLDTGALYRAVALTLIREKGREDEGAAIKIAEKFKQGIPPALLTDPELRIEAVSLMAAKVSAIPQVRQHLLELQKNFAHQAGGAVLDGRDIGTVIAPEAEIKLFVTASAEKRAERRWKELQKAGLSDTYDTVLKDMKERDARDAARPIAPTKQAADAVLLDTSAMDAEEAFQAALRIVEQTLSR